MKILLIIAIMFNATAGIYTLITAIKIPNDTLQLVAWSVINFALMFFNLFLLARRIKNNQ